MTPNITPPPPPKYSFFWTPPQKKSEIQNCWTPKKWPEPMSVWKYQSTPPPPFIKYKCSLYFCSTYTFGWILSNYRIIFLFTDNNHVLSQTANCDFWVFKQAARIPSRTEKVGTCHRHRKYLIVILMHDWTSCRNTTYMQKGWGSLNKLARSASMSEGGRLLIY